VEPLSGSAGVILPPKGYLKRLRELCDKHGILLIFDEVITGFGRMATPFASDFFDVTPDLMTTAKGLTNGVVPMGAVFSKAMIYETLLTVPPASNFSTAIPILVTHWLVLPGWLHSKYSKKKKCWSMRKA
jgi:beta-alanine--pyruvate transaminase